jgi:hypothetical protein
MIMQAKAQFTIVKLVQATVVMIVNYKHNMFKVNATAVRLNKN